MLGLKFHFDQESSFFITLKGTTKLYNRILIANLLTAASLLLARLWKLTKTPLSKDWLV